LSFEDASEYEPKGVADRWRLFRVADGGTQRVAFCFDVASSVCPDLFSLSALSA
jgi:hypothetical protein